MLKSRGLVALSLALIAPVAVFAQSQAKSAKPQAVTAKLGAGAVAKLEPIRLDRATRPSQTALAEDKKKGVKDTTPIRHFFALRLVPQVSAAAAPTDVVVLLDTSASQIGKIRDKGLATLEAFVGGLGKSDRVHVMAIDLNAVPMTESLAAAGSDAVKAGVEKLRKRVPLGSTDIVAGLKTALAAFDKKSTSRRTIVYIGDGISGANLAASEEFATVLTDLTAARVAVTSYSIGARRDDTLLAAVANQTGGMLFLDGEKFAAGEIAKHLNKWGSQTVVWPTKVQWPAEVTAYPKRMIPLRTDRDTVVIGRGDLPAGQKLAMSADVDGKRVELSWTIPATAPSDDHYYLKRLVETAAPDGGLSLATLGSNGLEAARSTIDRGVEVLMQTARQALTTGDLTGASTVLGQLRRIDPNDPELALLEKSLYTQADAARTAYQSKAREVAKTTKIATPAKKAAPKTAPAVKTKKLVSEETPADARRDAVKRGAAVPARRSVFRLTAFQDEEPPKEEPGAEPAPAEEAPAEEPPAAEPPAADEPATEPPAAEPPAAEAPAAEPPAAEPPAAEAPAAPPAAEAPEEVPTDDSAPTLPGDERFEGLVHQERVALNRQIEKEVEVDLNEARRMMRRSPAQAIRDLKLKHDFLHRTPFLFDEVRSQLMERVSAAIQSAEVLKLENDVNVALAEQAAGARQERERIQAQLLTDQEKIRQLVAQFRVLMDEGRFIEADESVASYIEELQPGAEVPPPGERDLTLSTHVRGVARTTGAYRVSLATYERHLKGMNDMLQQVDISGTPFSDDPPITYPPAEVWQELTNRRKEFASVDLQKRGGAEEKIFRALNETTELELIDTTLEDLSNIIETKHKIQVELDLKALEDVGASKDSTVTKNLKGISLRSALRLILKDLDLKYIVKDEVLQITSAEKAANELTTKVYPVADLVLKIKDIGFAGGFGNLGGFGNFGGLGQSQGGGGDAFGGGGGGGGGGAF